MASFYALPLIFKIQLKPLLKVSVISQMKVFQGQKPIPLQMWRSKLQKTNLEAGHFKELWFSSLFLSKRRSKQSHTTAKPMPSVWKPYFKHKQNQTLHMPSLSNICQNISEYLLLESQCGQAKEAKKPFGKSLAFLHWPALTLCPVIAVHPVHSTWGCYTTLFLPLCIYYPNNLTCFFFQNSGILQSIFVKQVFQPLPYHDTHSKSDYLYGTA